MASDVGKRVLITGGTGLIGRALSANMAADGYEVMVLSRNPEGPRRCLPAFAPSGGMRAPLRGGVRWPMVPGPW